MPPPLGIKQMFLKNEFLLLTMLGSLVSLAQFKWADGTLKEESVFLPEESITRLKQALEDSDLSSLYLIQRPFASSTTICSRHRFLLQSSLCYGNWNLSRLRETSFSLHRGEDEICGVHICLCRQGTSSLWPNILNIVLAPEDPLETEDIWLYCTNRIIK